MLFPIYNGYAHTGRYVLYQIQAGRVSPQDAKNWSIIYNFKGRETGATTAMFLRLATSTLESAITLVLRRLLPGRTQTANDLLVATSTAVSSFLLRPLQIAFIWESLKTERRRIPFTTLTTLITSNQNMWAGSLASVPHAVLSVFVSRWINRQLSQWVLAIDETEDETLESLLKNVSRKKVKKVFRSVMKKTFNKLIADTLTQIILLPLETLSVRQAVASFDNESIKSLTLAENISKIKLDGIFNGITAIIPTHIHSFSFLISSYVLLSLVIEFWVPEYDSDSDERANLLAYLSSPEPVNDQVLYEDEDEDEVELDEQEFDSYHVDPHQALNMLLSSLAQQEDEEEDEEDSVDENGNPRIIEVPE